MTPPRSQQRYVALLRAINVGGNNMVEMSRLRELFESFGLTGVRTYIQTGNVVFSSRESDPDKLEEQLAKKLHTALGLRTEVFVRSKQQLLNAVKQNPFSPELLDHIQHCHLMFLSHAPAKAQKDALMAKQGDQYQFAAIGDILYYAYSRELAGNRKTIPIEKLLQVRGTARTWKVINRLIEMLNED
jgi:uncharacterized protein (DUF1697 family)